ncbi:MAG: hypothetical protein O2964_19850, partial [Verrucomicrobia bacterium]|nr:hypothetical protein [Verrucomicrobiota bacterium]
MSKITRRRFITATSSLALLPSINGQESEALTGYSPGNVLSKIDGLDLLNLWGKQPEHNQQLYSLIEAVLSKSTRNTFADVSRDPKVLQFCERHRIHHLGGPMLGCVTTSGAKVWVRTVKPSNVEVRLKKDGEETTYGPVRSSEESDLVACVPVTGLQAGTS